MLRSDTVKVKLLDEVNAAIIGLKKEHIKFFTEHYRRRPPNHFFNPKFKLGVWDGFIYYFRETGKTFVYLLDEIIPQLQRFGYKIELIDNRMPSNLTFPLIDKTYISHIEDPETGEPMEFRYYQVDAVNAAMQHGGGVILAGTGAGKTLMNYAICRLSSDAGLKTVTIVPTTDLIAQTKEDFEYWKLDVGEYSGDTKELDHEHIISTWQALQNNPTIMSQFQVVIVDECHGLKGQVLTKLLNDNGKNIIYRFGLTGTLPKPETDAMAVRIAIGSVQYEISAKQLMDEDYLAKLHITIMQLEEDMTKQYANYITENPLSKITYLKFKDSYFPEYSAEKRYLQTDADRLDWIAACIEVKCDAKKGNVFCLVDGVNFGKKLAKLIPGATFVHGKDKKAARREIYQKFKHEDNIVVIATVNIASTGLNIKRIYNLMFIDVGKSFVRVIQTIGRGLRKAPDKDFVNVTDICTDLKYGRKHLRERIKFYKEAEYPYSKKKVKY